MLSCPRRIDGKVPSVNDNLLTTSISTRRGYQENNRANHLLSSALCRKHSVQYSSVLLRKVRDTHVPGLSAGTGRIPCPTMFVALAPLASRSAVSSDSYTPGATPETRTGIFLSTNSVAIIFVICATAAFELLYANYQVWASAIQARETLQIRRTWF